MCICNVFKVCSLCIVVLHGPVGSGMASHGTVWYACMRLRLYIYIYTFIDLGIYLTVYHSYVYISHDYIRIYICICT